MKFSLTDITYWGIGHTSYSHCDTLAGGQLINIIVAVIVDQIISSREYTLGNSFFCKSLNVINTFKFWKFRRDWGSLYIYTYLLLFKMIILLLQGLNRTVDTYQKLDEHIWENKILGHIWRTITVTMIFRVYLKK